MTRPASPSRKLDLRAAPKLALATSAPRLSLAETAYEKLKESIFDFQLLPGDRFSESEIAERLKMSRTPVRDALYRLEREGHVQVHLRSGWSVRAYDFEHFEALYDLRLILEEASVTRLCELEDRPALDELKAQWLVTAGERLKDPKAVSTLDEAFHVSLVAAAGNAEVARCHVEVSERIRIIRRLDFTQPNRVDKTYDEHAQILRAVMRRRADEARRLLRSHIETSKAEVRKITLHRLYTARSSSHV
jgi:DNA-binding GntR family transcriptional regulator